jgi:hypothetical protein
VGGVVGVDRKRLLGVSGIVAVVAVALVLLSLVILPALLAKPNPSASAIELAAVDVSFVGSGAGNATLGQNDCGCGALYSIGSSITELFDVEVPPVAQASCADLPHTYSITQIAGPASGGFQVTGAQWEYPVAQASLSALPVALPGCPNGMSPVNGAEFYVGVAVVNSGTSIQTLVLTVTVTQDS